MEEDMPSDREDSAMQLAEEIRDYLAAHPNAADSAEGIARWWLTRRRPPAALTGVVAALEYLERLGLIESQRRQDGEVLYRSARQRDADKR